MYKNSVLKKAISLISAAFVGSLVIVPGVLADSDTFYDSDKCQSQTKNRNDSKKFSVKDSRELEIYA